MPRNWEATQRENELLNESAALLAVIGAEIDARRRDGGNGERHYGHVGDAANMRDKLVELVMCWEIGDDEDEQEVRDRILRAVRS